MSTSGPIARKYRLPRLTTQSSLGSVQEELASRSRDSELATQLITLMQEIDAAVESDRGKVIQFVASEEGEGTSTVVLELAHVASADLEKTVLLLRADNATSDEDGEAPLVRALSDSPDPSSPLVVSTFDVGGAYHSLAAGSTALESYFDGLKDRFDLTLIDSPPAGKSMDAVAVSAVVDGVVLVVEADRATWKSGQTLKERIVQAGGKILGVVLNKRTQHVPAIVRRYL